MSLDEELVKKKLREMKARYPEMDIDRIEHELFPLKGDEIHPVVGKKKRQ
jgi:hypothetical protein